jgi:hypothetical protein
MWRSYWGKVARRALAEVRVEIPIGTPLRLTIALVTAVVAFSFLFVAGGTPPSLAPFAGIMTSFFLAGLAVIWKLSTIPPKLACEAEARHAEAVTLAHRERDAVHEEVIRLKAAPPQPLRDPDGIYQWDGERVGTAQQVLEDIPHGQIIIGLLLGSERFSINHQFEYRGFKLRMRNISGGGGIGFGSTIGGVERTHSMQMRYQNVVCAIED